MREILESCFRGPAFPASVLLILVALYWVSVIIGVFDLDLFDIDVDGGGEPDFEGMPGIGLTVLRALNIGRIPIMLWLSVFAVTFWFVSYVWNRPVYVESSWLAFQILLRNGAIALVATKILTQPMLRWVDRTRMTSAVDLVGRICEITTSEVNASRGQARIHTDAAPLLLDARAHGAPLAKGDTARIVEYDSVKNVYYVEKTKPEVEVSRFCTASRKWTCR